MLLFSPTALFLGIAFTAFSLAQNVSVTFDKYSLKVNGQRLVIWAGEFHYWRLPIPSLWLDLLQKLKAHGFNTVSFYGHWGYHASSNATLDFDTRTHDPRPLLKMAKDVGLFVIFRPGPYVNAESHSGGHAQWVTNGRFGTLRNNDPRYVAAYSPYMDTYEKILAPEQLGKGGTVIAVQLENEFWSTDAASIDYMRQLKEQARKNGIVVPLTHNNPSTSSKAWSSEYRPNAGAVDISGFDTYPYCWSCNLSECGGRTPYTVVPYYEWFREVSPNQPPYIPEFQGGSYSPWGSPGGGCIEKQNSEFVNLMYRHNIGERVTMLTIYVFFGGTNWGNIGYSPAQTSYDYSAAISESRLLQDKYFEGKSLGLFIDAARDLAKTDRIYTGSGLTSSSVPLNVSVLENPDTKARFYVIRHAPSDRAAPTTFNIKITTSEGQLTVPQTGKATLAGLNSKILLSDFVFGKYKLLYTTAEVLTHAIVDQQSTLILWLPDGEQGEFAIANYSSNKRTILQKCNDCKVELMSKAKSTVVNFEQKKDGLNVLDFDGFRIVTVDRNTAWKTYVPKLSKDPIAGPEENIVVHGARLVRSAEVRGDTILLTGDVDNTTKLQVHAPKSVAKLSWNGKPVSEVSRNTINGLLEATLPGPTDASKIRSTILSQLASGSWRSQDSLPEIAPEYDDSRWTIANLNTTSIPQKPETLPVLYSEDYSFFHGYILYRARFTATSSTSTLNLAAKFGNAGGYSIFINGGFIGSWVGTIEGQGSGSYSIPKSSLKTNGVNVLMVLLDHNGKDQNTDTIPNFRGIYRATLNSGGFQSWRIQGNAGGTDNIDPTRGPYNEGGLYAERVGWHLPGFPGDSAWSIVNSFKSSKPTVTFFRKTFRLDVPEGYDVPLAIKLSSPKGQKMRVQIWVNGYQYGKYMPQVGGQEVFPIPQGVLEYSGENTVAVSVWNVEGKEIELGLEWSVLAVYESSLKVREDGESIRPKWTEGRGKYA